ncbi:MAG TPA: transglycosylase domain-containing protein, partial [Steroidobacteraceae bacterium]|nr:transglycosylase domain-containing protein [Steroidobacteraceae bacterium]
MPTRKVIVKKILRYSLIAFGVVLLSLGVWVGYLDHVVRKQFEGRRWTLPAQVYAQPLELYTGQSITADGLERELRRLGYRRSEQPRQAGNYRRRDARIDFISRPFQFIDEARPARAMSVIIGKNAIDRMWDGEGQEQPVFRLDPMLIGSIFPIHGEDRIIVTPDQVPPLLPTALKIVEDRKFDKHIGVDPLAILRATWANVRAGQIEQGASTLTQQLVRSYFLDNRRTFGRKIEEAMMSVLLELHFDKADLMNSYINEIHLGQEGDRAVHGFGLASQFYFGKPLDELELHETATLVAVVRGPSYYDPRRHPERVLERRNLVLDLLAQFKAISANDAKIAKTKPLGVQSSNTQANQSSTYYPAFLGMVRRSLRRDYREEDLTEAGLKIFTTLDPTVQMVAERALIDELTTLDKSRKRKDAELEGVVVVTAPHSGEVIAIVGG